MNDHGSQIFRLAQQMHGCAPWSICKGPVKSKVIAGKTRAATDECIVNESPGDVPTCDRRVTRHVRRPTVVYKLQIVNLERCCASKVACSNLR